MRSPTPCDSASETAGGGGDAVTQGFCPLTAKGNKGVVSKDHAHIQISKSEKNGNPLSIISTTSRMANDFCLNNVEVHCGRRRQIFPEEWPVNYIGTHGNLSEFPKRK